MGWPFGNDDTSSTNSVAEVNSLSAAVSDLRKYYIMLGNPDISSTRAVSGAPGEVAGTLPIPTGVPIPFGPTEVPVQVPVAAVSGKTIENIMYVTMDNTEAAYFAGDMVTSTKLLSYFATDSVQGIPTYAGISNYFQIYQEGTDEAYGSGIEPAVKGGKDQAGGFLMSTIQDHQVATSPQPGANTDVSVRHVVSTSKTVESETSLLPIDGLNTENVSDSSGGGPDRFLRPSLVGFVFPNHRIGPARRGTAAVSLFANSIPTIEMSRCLPYVSMRFISAVPPSLGKRTSQLSISRFLGMNDPGNEHDKIGFGMALPHLLAEQNFLLLDDDSGSKYATSLTSAGFELFSSPQLMVNANINSESEMFSGTAGNVLDPFAPLMTLESLSVQVAGLGQALLANRTATVQFTLHDRSRMPDIAPLISADLFSSTYIMLEYGWFHPDGEEGSQNAFGRLLSTMRSKGAFNIVATNFRISNDGQVKFTMKLASRGAPEANAFPIATGNLMPVGPFKQMISSFLAEHLNALEAVDGSTTSDDVAREIRERINVSNNTAYSSSSVVTRKLFLAFQEFVKPTDGKVPSDELLIEKLEELVGDPTSGTEGAISQEGSKRSLGAEVNAKLDAILKTSDPWKIDVSPGSFIGKSVSEAGITPERTVSLGKILMAFVGAPLAGSGRFDEVQLMFYRFNNQAAAARDLPSIASFLVDIDNLSADMRDLIQTSPGMSISAFMSTLNDKVIGKKGNPSYGMTDVQSRLTAAGNITVEATDSETEAAAAERRQNAIQDINNAVEVRLGQIYQDGEFAEPSFKQPQIRISFETMPAFVRKNDDTFKIDPSKSILRVHIFDTQASPNVDQQFLINASTDKNFTTALGLGSSSSPEAVAAEGGGTPPSEGSDGEVTAAAERGDIETLTPNEETQYQVYVSKIPNSEIKRIIKSSAPSLTFGVGFTALNSISMSSSTNGSVPQVLLLNALKEANRDPAGSGPTAGSSEFEDIQVIPASATANMLGCPLVEYGQHFYVDMGTGTTADNMYYVTGIEHTIRPGEFITSLSLTFSANGTMTTFRSILSAALPGLKERLARTGA